MHSKLDGALELILKLLLFQKSNAFESSHSHEPDIGVYASRFWKNIFWPKYIDLVQSVQIYLVYRYPATSAKHFSFANMAMDSW